MAAGELEAVVDEAAAVEDSAMAAVVDEAAVDEEEEAALAVDEAEDFGHHNGLR